METVPWQTILGFIAIVTLSLTFAGFWMTISRQIAEAKASAEAAKTEAESAGMRGVQANLKIDGIQDELWKFQRYAEREFVNHDHVKQMSDRHEAQFTDLRGDLKGITQRLDRLLENRVYPASD